MKPKFCFASGNIWRWRNSPNRNVLLDYIKKLDISGVELTFATKKELYAFNLSQTNRRWLQSLDYVTIHAPFCLYEDSENEAEVADQIDTISKMYHDLNAKNVIVHPEKKLFSSGLLNKGDIRISVENLPRKSGILTSDLQAIFERHPQLSFCLDVSHAYSWSKSETRKLIDAFQDKISQIHFSGHYRKKDHQSLRKVSRAFLCSIQPIKHLEVPIVIEEDMAPNALEFVKEEIKFIRKLFR